MKYVLIVLGFLLALCFVTWAASHLRMRQGEDVKILTDAERDTVVESVRYARDPRTNLCFAILAQNTDGWRTTFSIALVPNENCGR